jgi:hypothetical protein
MSSRVIHGSSAWHNELRQRGDGKVPSGSGSVHVLARNSLAELPSSSFLAGINARLYNANTLLAS